MINDFILIKLRAYQVVLVNIILKQRIAILFMIEHSAKHPKKYYASNKTDVFYLDDTWGIDLSDFNDCGPKKNKGCRYISVVIEHFYKFGWISPLGKMLEQKRTHLRTTSFLRKLGRICRIQLLEKNL